MKLAFLGTLIFITLICADPKCYLYGEEPVKNTKTLCFVIKQFKNDSTKKNIQTWKPKKKNKIESGEEKPIDNCKYLKNLFSHLRERF